MDADRLNTALEIWELINGTQTQGEAIVAIYDRLEDEHIRGFSAGADWMQDAEEEAANEDEPEEEVPAFLPAERPASDGSYKSPIFSDF